MFDGIWRGKIMFQQKNVSFFLSPLLVKTGVCLECDDRHTACIRHPVGLDLLWSLQKFLTRKFSVNYESVKKHIQKCCASKPVQFDADGILKLFERWTEGGEAKPHGIMFFCESAHTLITGNLHIFIAPLIPKENSNCLLIVDSLYPILPPCYT